GDRRRKHFSKAFRAFVSSTGIQKRSQGSEAGHPRCDGRSRQTHVLLDDHYHHGPYPDLYAAAARRPHFRAHGLDRDIGPGRIADAFTVAGTAALLLLPEERHIRKRKPRRPNLQTDLSARP